MQHELSVRLRDHRGQLQLRQHVPLALLIPAYPDATHPLMRSAVLQTNPPVPAVTVLGAEVSLAARLKALQRNPSLAGIAR